MSEDRSTSLYRYFDAEGDLLYIGIAYDPDQRKKGHAVTAADSWYPLIAERKVEVFFSRAEAEEAEERAIRAEKPRYNRQYVDRRDPVVTAQDRARERRRSAIGAVGGGGQPPQHSGLIRLLRERIDSGYYQPGESLPTKEQLIKTFGINAYTLRMAMADLAKDGYIRKAGIHGYLVLPPEERRISVCVGHPEEAAAELRAAMTTEQIAALISALQAPQAKTA